MTFNVSDWNSEQICRSDWVSSGDSLWSVGQTHSLSLASQLLLKLIVDHLANFSAEPGVFSMFSEQLKKTYFNILIKPERLGKYVSPQPDTTVELSGKAALYSAGIRLTSITSLFAGTSVCWSWSTVAGRSYRSTRPSWRVWPSMTSWPSSRGWRRSFTPRGWCRETSPARWDRVSWCRKQTLKQMSLSSWTCVVQ